MAFIISYHHHMCRDAYGRALLPCSNSALTYLRLRLNADVKLLHSKTQRARYRMPTKSEHAVAARTCDVREFPASFNDSDTLLRRTNAAATARHDGGGTFLLSRIYEVKRSAVDA